jgi:hypothetical protein
VLLLLKVALVICDMVNGTTGNPAGTMPFGILPFGDQSDTRDATPLWTYGDSVSWTKGKHSFKFGGELRKGYSKVWDAGFVGGGIFTQPRLIGGDLTTSPISTTAIGSTNMPGLAGTNASGNNQRMRNLLSFLAGSLSGVTQYYYMNSPNKLDAFEDYKSAPQRIRDFRQNEFVFFAKDDWKARRNLTLNVGVRWEYYGVPWEARGLTSGLAGGSGSLFGLSGNSFDNWFSHTPRGGLTQIQFIGPNSANPSQLLFPKHWGNVGPAVGFAWQVPWFGEGKTTVRGGYQITYQNTIGLQIADPPTSAYSAIYQGDSAHPYLDMSNSQSLVPVFVPSKPMQPILVMDRTQSVSAYEPNCQGIARWAHRHDENGSCGSRLTPRLTSSDDRPPCLTNPITKWPRSSFSCSLLQPQSAGQRMWRRPSTCNQTRSNVGSRTSASTRGLP